MCDWADHDNQTLHSGDSFLCIQMVWAVRGKSFQLTQIHSARHWESAAAAAAAAAAGEELKYNLNLSQPKDFCWCWLITCHWIGYTGRASPHTHHCWGIQQGCLKGERVCCLTMYCCIVRFRLWCVVLPECCVIVLGMCPRWSGARFKIKTRCEESINQSNLIFTAHICPKPSTGVKKNYHKKPFNRENSLETSEGATSEGSLSQDWQKCDRCRM